MFIIRTHFTKYILFYILCSLSGHTSQNTLCFTFYVHYQVHFTKYNVFYTLCSFIITTLYKTHFVIHFMFIISSCFNGVFECGNLYFQKVIKPAFYFKFNFSKSSFTIFVYINKSRNTKKLSCKKRKNFF